MGSWGGGGGQLGRGQLGREGGRGGEDGQLGREEGRGLGREGWGGGGGTFVPTGNCLSPPPLKL